MGFYNRANAIMYAVRWALVENPAWPYFGHGHGGGDCTNFISQCLYAGGWDMRYGAASPLEWYCWPKRGQGHSRTWASADLFAYCLRNNGRTRPCQFSELTVGDLVLEEIADYGIRHIMMVTKKTSEDIFLSYHSTNYLNTPFKEVKERVGIYNKLSFVKVLDFYEDDDGPFWMQTTTEVSYWRKQDVPPRF